MDTCGKPLAMGATTKLEYLRRPSGYKDFGKNWTGTGDSQAIVDGPQRCRSHGVPVGVGMAVEVIQHHCINLNDGRAPQFTGRQVAKRQASQQGRG